MFFFRLFRFILLSSYALSECGRRKTVIILSVARVESKKMFNLMMNSTHFIYSYRTYGKRPLRERERGNLLLPLHGLLILISGALAGTRNRLMGPPCGIDLMTHHIMNRCSTTVARL